MKIAVYYFRLILSQLKNNGTILICPEVFRIVFKGLMILARTVSLIGHSIEEMEREKGWRASGKSDITQPLDLSLQLPEFYDGPAERSLAE